MALRLTRRSYLAAGLAVAFVLVLFVGGRAAWRLAHRFDRPPIPRQTDVSQIAGWMSVPYVGRAYRVPPPELYAALGVPPEDRDSRRFSTLDEIAAATGQSSDEVLAIVRATVTNWQATHPPSGRDGAARDGPGGGPDRNVPKPDPPQPGRPPQ